MSTKKKRRIVPHFHKITTIPFQPSIILSINGTVSLTKALSRKRIFFVFRKDSSTVATDSPTGKRTMATKIFPNVGSALYRFALKGLARARQTLRNKILNEVESIHYHCIRTMKRKMTGGLEQENFNG